MAAEFHFITKRELCSMLGVSRATVERLTAKNHLPRPYKLGNHAVRWRSDEVAECINNMPRIDNAYSCHIGRGGAK